MSAGQEFWAFSLKVYAAPGVKDACLALQAAGLDVNVALWIVFAAVDGRDPAARLEAADAISRDWSGAVVHPLRAARDALQPAPGFADPAAAAELREAVLEAELAAERIEQFALAPLTGRCPTVVGEPRDRALGALEAYADIRGSRAPCGRFIEAVFSAVENR